MSTDHVERDSLGEVRVPDDVYYGAQTRRAGLNFPVSGRGLLPALKELQGALVNRARAFDDVLKIGRTHLQDATPVRLGQEFAGYGRMVERGRQRLAEARAVLEEVALGGTAVGTGMNTHPEFATRLLAELNAEAGLSLRAAPNYFAALGSRPA